MDKNKFKQRMKDLPLFLLIYTLISIASDLITKRIDFSFQSILISLPKKAVTSIITFLGTALFWYLFGLTEKKK